MIYLNREEVEFERFPNGETRVDTQRIQRLFRPLEKNYITLKYVDDSDLIKLRFLKNFIDAQREKNTAYRGTVQLRILYMPYSRMDRTEGASAFTLKYVSNMINDMGFSMVEVVEPHSDVTLALLENVTASYPAKELLNTVAAQIGFNILDDVLMFPDAGAAKRYHDVNWANQAVGMKNRNFQTGRIEGMEVYTKAPVEGRKALIVDDLCSYGGTFIMAAEKLRKMGAAEVYLLVTHAENAIYEGRLLWLEYAPGVPLINGVFTTNSIIGSDVPEKYKEKVTVFDIIHREGE